MNFGDVRYSLRGAGFVGLTFSLYAGFKLELALAKDDAARARVVAKWMNYYGVGLLKLFGIECRAEGPFVDRGIRYPGTDARGRGRVFVMNHRSTLDVFITLAFVEATIVSRADLARWPVIGTVARGTGVLFVDRSDKKSGANVIAAMTGAIERGRGVMVYPEGTTFAGDEVRPFKPGAFLAAHKTGAEIVPVGLTYEREDACYLDEPVNVHLKRVASARLTRAAISVGDPIPSDGKDVDVLKEEARSSVQSLVHKARRMLAPS